MMKSIIKIVDTTLRDGEQEAGKVFSLQNKINIVNYLEKSGVYQIEAGIPAMGSYEKRCIKKIIEIRQKALISTWNRLNLNDIKHSFECKPDIIHISVPISDIQIKNKLNTNKKYIEDEIKKCISFAKDKGYEVTIGFEDATRADENYLFHLCSIISALGISRVRYSDTVGVLTLRKTDEIIRKIINEYGLQVEIHAHNDFGMALGISLEAIKAGAEFVDCTIDGIGERAGNCDMKKLLDVIKMYKTE